MAYRAVRVQRVRVLSSILRRDATSLAIRKQRQGCEDDISSRYRYCTADNIGYRSRWLIATR